MNRACEKRKRFTIHISSLALPCTVAFLADNPFYPKRFAVYAGWRCSTSTIKDVAKELHLDRKTVKELGKQYLREKLRRAYGLRDEEYLRRKVLTCMLPDI
jgi:hypothetical protein